MRSIPGIERGDFKAAVNGGPEGQVQVVLSGFADAGLRDALNEMLLRLHEAALAGAVRTVDLDLSGLEYLSSACIRPVLQWLRRLRDGGAQYGVSVLIRPESFWQRRSAIALKGFAPNVVSCDVEE